MQETRGQSRVSMKDGQFNISVNAETIEFAFLMAYDVLERVMKDKLTKIDSRYGQLELPELVKVLNNELGIESTTVRQLGVVQ